MESQNDKIVRLEKEIIDLKFALKKEKTKFPNYGNKIDYEKREDFWKEIDKKKDRGLKYKEIVEWLLVNNIPTFTGKGTWSVSALNRGLMKRRRDQLRVIVDNIIDEHDNHHIERVLEYFIDNKIPVVDTKQNEWNLDMIIKEFF